MQTRYWLGGTFAAVVAVAVLGSARRGPPAFVWTDGTSICESPGGPPIVGFRQWPWPGFWSYDGPVDMHDGVHINFLGDDSQPPAPEHWDRIVLVEDTSRIAEWVYSVSSIDLGPTTLDPVAYDPVHGRPDVIDADGAAWWRCDVAR